METLITKKAQTEIKNTREIYLDILKTIAIIGVLTIHITSRGFNLYPVFSTEYNISGFISCMVRFSVPVFVMVSGALFLADKKEIGIKKIFKNYLPRIIWALVIFAVFYETVPVIFKFLKTGVIEKALIDRGILNLINLNTHFHLYYLYIVIILYLLVPVIKVYLKSATKRNTEYLIAFLFIFSIAYSAIKSIYPFSLVTGGITSQYAINLTYGMLLYFLWGYYLSKYELKRKTENIILVSGIVAVIFTFFATALKSFKTNQFDGQFVEAMTVNVFLMSTALFVWMKKISVKVKKPEKFIFISKASFLIYLVHDFYNIVFEELGLSIVSFSPVLSIPLMLILVFSSSILTYLVLKKIPFINKIL